jgi:signal transduction histidine kinase
MTSPPAQPRRRTVSDRLLGGYLLVLIAFAVTVGWSFQALRAAARDAELLRAGYVPLLLRIGEALAEQNVFDAQLNHITAAKNPGDVREWIDTARRTRPLTFAQVRKAAEREVAGDADAAARRFRDEIAREAAAIERSLDTEPERFSRLFQALSVGDREAAEKARDDLVKREAEGAQRLRAMRGRVEEAMASLTAEARHREERSVQLLVGLGLLTLLVGLMISIYARRVLAPLTAVTDRAKAVARGDLTPHEVVATNDEIGELATTFEGMVAAIQRARAELVQAERLATIGKMAAHVTHEIRNPLSSIGLNIELLDEEMGKGAIPGEARALLGAITREVERLEHLSEEYLRVARLPSPRMEADDVATAVREVVEFARPEIVRAGCTVTFRADEPVPPALFDESQLRQALLNLLRNAREAMSDGGPIDVHVGAEGMSVVIDIADRGGGIPQDIRARVFDPFFSTKGEGTGLGLAITRQIVEAHGGSIACDSRDEGGTRFRLSLPIAPSRATSTHLQRRAL